MMYYTAGKPERRQKEMNAEMTAAEISLRLSGMMDEIAEMADYLDENLGRGDSAEALDRVCEMIREARMKMRRGDE